MATEVFGALISLARLIKQASDDAAANTSTSKSLKDRIDLVLRVLGAHPEPQRLDEKLMGNLFRLLKDAHDHIISYKKASQLSRVMNSSTIKKRFDDLDTAIGKALDDLTLCVVVTSAETLEEIKQGVLSIASSLSAPLVDETHYQFLVDYNHIEQLSTEVVGGRYNKIFLAKVMKSSTSSLCPNLVYAVKTFEDSFVFSSISSCTTFLEMLTSLRHSSYVCCVLGGGSLPASNSSSIYPFLVMEYMSGGSLFDMVMSESIPAESETDKRNFLLATMFGIASGLAYLHDHYVIHGNISPFHILFDGAMNPKIIDFGIKVEVAMSSNDRTDSSKSNSQALLDIDKLSTQSLVWLAPEQVRGQLSTASRAADVYSLALVFSFSICGQVPYNYNATSANGRNQLLELIRNESKRPRIVSTSDPLFIPALQQLLPICLEVNATIRPSAKHVEKSLFTACRENFVVLQSTPVYLNDDKASSMVVNLLANEVHRASSDESDGLMSGFDEVTSVIESLTSTAKLFTCNSEDNSFVGYEGSDYKSCLLATYGSKVVVMNLPTAPKEAVVSTLCVDSDEFEGHGLLQDDIGDATGIVILHIDNTKSMSRENRMTLTRQVLHRIIPQLLRLGYQVVVNAWSVKSRAAATSADDNMIATRIINRKDTVPLLAEASATELESYLESNVFDIFTTEGLTDLYGSCYRLFKQMIDKIKQQTSVTCVPIYAFLLTDGNHNVLARPLHHPTTAGEAYFDYRAVENANGSLKWCGVPSSSNEQEIVCNYQKYLRSEFDKMSSECQSLASAESSTSTQLFSFTIVGIGDADPASLSGVAASLGPAVNFFGVTEVQHADAVFMGICSRSDINQKELTLSWSSKEEGSRTFSLYFSYTEEVDGCICASLIVPEASVLQSLHQAASLTVRAGNSSRGVTFVPASHSSPSSASSPAELGAFRQSQQVYEAELVTSLIQEFLRSLSSIRSTTYNISPETFASVFRQLIEDQKALQRVKGSYYVRKLRKLRHQYGLLHGISLWIRELEDIIQTQLDAYRMNVESDLLRDLLQQGEARVALGESRSSIQPSDKAIARLQHNLAAAGKNAHRVKKLVASVQSIRDRTIHITSLLVKNSLSLAQTDVGLVLSVKGTKTVTKDKMVVGTEAFEKEYYWNEGRHGSAHIFSALETSEANIANESVSYYQTAIAKCAALSEPAVSFPCVILKSRFDPFGIVRAPQSFVLTSILCHRGRGDPSAAVFCSQELWELCQASGHAPGLPLPLVVNSHNQEQDVFIQVPLNKQSVEREWACSTGGNMILPHAYTPFLFALYTHFGRCLASAINITGDLLALTPVSLQWARFYCDVAAFAVDLGVLSSSSSPATADASCGMWLVEGLRALCAFSYSLQWRVAAWATGVDYVKAMFSSCLASDSNVSTKDASAAAVSYMENVVLSREVVSALHCQLAVASLVAVNERVLDGDNNYIANAWNLIVRTMFSRMCESISGIKILRNHGCGDSSNSRDLGELEDAYRIHIGNLQTVLQRRLHVEWAKCSWEEKCSIVAQNDQQVFKLLTEIITEYLAKFEQYGITESWRSALDLLRRSLLLSNYSVEKLRADFIEGDTDAIDALVKRLSAIIGLESYEGLIVIVNNTLGHQSSFGSVDGQAQFHLEMRPLVPHDHTHLVCFIDAIVATKVAPKIVYKPVLNPAFPVVDAGSNRRINEGISKVHASYSEWNLKLPVANVTFVGNVNSGKSSISGRMLTTFGVFNPASLSLLGEEAVKLGHSESVKYAWLIDKTPESRSTGFTITPTWSGFQSNMRRFTIIDNPGHKDYTRNATFGIFHADICVLVTSAVMSEIEISELAAGQAHDHLLTAFCFGVKQIVVAVNKMDLVSFSAAEFERVCSYWLKVVKKIGFKEHHVVFVPVSVLANDGIIGFSENLSWFTGKCLMQSLDEVHIPPRSLEQPFRMAISEVYQSQSKCVTSSSSCSYKGYYIVCGKIDSGVICVNDSVVGMPSCSSFGGGGIVKSIHCVGDISVESASAGDDVGLLIQPAQVSVSLGTKLLSHPQKVKSVRDAKRYFQRGMVLTSAVKASISIITKFEAQIFIVGGVPLKVQMCPVISIHLDLVTVTIQRITAILKKTGEVEATDPAEIKPAQIGVFELQAHRPFAADTIHSNPKFSRFVIKANRVVVAVGFIRAIL